MSTSKGVGAAAHTIGSVIPPEQLRFLFVRNRPESSIEFDPEGTDAIPRLFDEFDRLGAATAGREVKGELPSGHESIFRYSLLDPAADVAAAAAAFRPAFGHLALLVQVPGVDVHERVAAEKGSPLTACRGGRARDAARRRTPLARGVRAGARPDRDPPRRRPGRGRAPAPGAARLPPRARRRGPRRGPRERRAVAGRDLRRRRRARSRRQGRVQRPVPRVPRPAQRPARRLAAREPRTRLRHPPAPRRRRARGGHRMSVGVAAAPRGARPRSARARSTSARTRRSSTARSRWTRPAAGSSPSRTRSRPSATPHRSRSARRSAAARSRTAPRSRSCAPRPRAPASASTQIDAELAATEAELEDLLLRIPNPADPEVPVGGEEANVTVRTWGEQLIPREATAPDGAAWERRPHWEIGEALDIIDNPRGAKIAGSGLPGLQGRGIAAPAQPHLVVPRRPHRRARLHRGLAAGRRQHRVGARHRPDPGQGRPDVRRHARRPVPGPDRRGPGHEPPSATRSSRRTSCRSATRPTRRASAARRARPARTPAASSASTSSTRSRWSCSRSRRTAPRRSSG